MCKYCKWDYSDKFESTGSHSIGKIRDGIAEFEVEMSRYILPEQNIHRANLLLSVNARVDKNTNYMINSKVIPIQYCPFCGEKL